MHYPVDIAMRDIPRSGALEQYIDDAAHRLERICAGIRSCQLLAEALGPGERCAAQFAVRLVISLPGTEIVVNRESCDDVRPALEDAFAAAGLQLRDYVRRLGAGAAGNRGHHSGSRA